MRTFILRVRKGPTTPSFSLDDLPGAGHLEIVCHCVANALFVSKQIRPETAIHIVLEGGGAAPKTVTFSSETLGSLGGWDERTIAGALHEALQAGRHLQLDEETVSPSGVGVAKRSFEALVKRMATESALFYLNKKGDDIRVAALDPAHNPNVTFVFTDHMAMPKKSAKHLTRLGASPISVGPRTLFASQVIVLAHNELDRLSFP